MFLSEWRGFPSAPCLAEKKNKLDECSRLDVVEIVRLPPWHASELVSFLVGLRTYQHPDTKLCELTSRSTVIFLFMAASMAKRTKEFYLQFPPEQCLPNLFTRGPPFATPDLPSLLTYMQMFGWQVSRIKYLNLRTGFRYMRIHTIIICNNVLHDWNLIVGCVSLRGYRGFLNQIF